MRDLTICLLSTLNILIFSFIILNGQALKKVDAFAEQAAHTQIGFDQLTAQIQQSLLKQQSNLQKKLQEKTGRDAINRVSTDSEITIPAIKVSAPIIFHDHLSSEEAQQKLEEGAISLNEFIPPSQPGQTIIFGHSSDYPWHHNEYANLFTLLPRLKAGDEITIRNDQSIYKYVVEKSMITPTDLEGIIETNPDDNELVLSTCYPIGFFSKRFNVIARPVRN